MLGQDNQQNNGKLFVLKPKTHDIDKKKLDHPVFEVSEKNEQNKWTVTNTVPSVSGRLSKLEIKEWDWEGEKNYTASLLIKDDEAAESYLVDFKVGNMMNRAIINSLLNINTEESIKIGLYTSKKGYPSGSVRQGENLIDWKFGFEDQPKPEEITFKGKVQRDYTEVDRFFVEKLKELAARINGAPAPAAEKPKKVAKVNKKVDTLTEKDAEKADPTDDDLF